MQFLSNFFNLNPSIFYFFSLMIGILFQFRIYIVPTLFLTVLISINYKKQPMMVFGFLWFLFGLFFFPLSENKQDIMITGNPETYFLAVEQINPKFRFGQKNYQIKGDLKNSEGQSVPVTTYINPKKCTKLNSQLTVDGILFERNGFYYLQKPKIHSNEANQFNLTFLRAQLKSSVLEHYHEFMFSGKSRSLIEGLSVGCCFDQDLKEVLNRYGLNHLLAISGFHFSIIIGSFLTLFRSCQPAIRGYVVFAIVNLYFLFIGPSPSVTRCYLMSMIGWILWRYNHLSYLPNILGWSAIIEILIWPKYIDAMGFWFSYGCTLILILNAKNIYEVCKSLPFFWKYFMSTCLACLVVFIFTAPLNLFFFEIVNGWSYFYNLWVPILFIPLMWLIPLNILSIFLPNFLAKIILETTQKLSDGILSLLRLPEKYHFFYQQSLLFEHLLVIQFLMLLAAFWSWQKNLAAND